MWKLRASFLRKQESSLFKLFDEAIAAAAAITMLIKSLTKNRKQILIYSSLPPWTWFYPIEAIRERVINALVHRDWTRFVDIEVGIYSDRIEVISPGVLQNAMTIEKMKAGQRSPRNSLKASPIKRPFKQDAGATFECTKNGT